MNDFIGQIILVAFNFAPVGFMACDGRLLPISQYTALFSLLGTTFGGDGKTTFALPNYTGQAPKDSQYVIAVQGIYPSRD